MSSSHMQGLTIILTYIPLVVAALNSSLTISPASERAADLTRASAEIFESVSSVISWSCSKECTKETRPHNHRWGNALNSENNNKKQVFSCSSTYRYVNLKCFYTRRIKKKVTKG